MKIDRAGQRRSRQREIVLEVICNAPGPLPVAEICQRARLVLCNISVATVYRNLSLLLAAQQIRRVMLHDGEPLYEAGDAVAQAYFRCRECALVFGIKRVGLPAVSGQITEQGFVTEGFYLSLSGICPRCLLQCQNPARSTKRNSEIQEEKLSEAAT